MDGFDTYVHVKTRKNQYFWGKMEENELNKHILIHFNITKEAIFSI